MATSAQVRGKSEEIDNGIERQRRNCRDAKNLFSAAVTALGKYPTQFQDYLDTVDGYVPDGAFETLQKDIKAKQVAEFTELQIAAQSAVDFLASITEF